MDLLSKRYANPCFFLDGMIQSGRFCEFVDDFAKAINTDFEIERKEKEWRLHWECWLHKIFDKDFKDYLAEIKNREKHQNMTDRTLETTVQHSMDILNNFNPEQGGE